jgi:hypothetical protein
VTLTNLCKTPFVWYGGKRHAAPAVWAALGDTPHYVEPFAGSLAVLLQRPHPANRTYYSETANDADGLICNFFRALQHDPQGVAEAASYPVSECDLHARHLAVLRWATDPERAAWLMGDPRHYDATIAGWWCWGVSCWIGSGFASGDGPWVADARGVLVRRGGPGVKRQLPHLGDNGQGVNHAGAREPGVSRQLPHLGDDGRGVNRPQAREPGVRGAAGAGAEDWRERAAADYAASEGAEDWRERAAADYAASEGYHPLVMPEVRRWMAYLAARLRHVRVLCGDWRRAVTTGAAHTLPVRQGDGPAGIFLDPPYANELRAAGLYAHDDGDVAVDVRAWCLANGANPRYRIVLAGFAGEGHEELEAHGWTAQAWFKDGWLKGGMGNQNANGHQQHKERLWFSPHCIRADALPMDALWSEEAA